MGVAYVPGQLERLLMEKRTHEKDSIFHERPDGACEVQRPHG